MHDGTVEHTSMRVTPWLALIVGGFLSACAMPADNPFTAFADPGKYQFYNCEQLAGMRVFWRGREQELKMLMDKAEKGTGGAIVNVLAYRGDHVGAMEELRVIEATARIKKCPPPS
jgi:hypothetical protein